MSSTPRFAALTHRDFRLLWFGRIPSVLGSQMQQIAIGWHVFQLLENGANPAINFFGRAISLDVQALGLGSLGLIRILPIIFFALLGGIVADTRDRRNILIATQSTAALVAAGLAYVTFNGSITLPLLYLLTAVESATRAFDNPASQAFIPTLVPRKHFTNATTLNSLVFQTGTIAGPGIGGLLIANFGIELVYAINAVTFMTVIISLFLIPSRGKPEGNTNFDIAAIVDGLRFTYRNKLVWSTMLIDFSATFFGSARTMLPLIADRVFGLGATGYGILATAQPLGAVLAGLIISLRTEIRNQGLVLLAGVLVYGVATTLFGLSTVFSISYLMFALTGVGDTVSQVIRSTLRQLSTPDELRGRMTSVNMIFYMGGPSLGEVEAGLVAALYGAPIAIVTGGIATVAITIFLAFRYPELRKYDH